MIALSNPSVWSISDIPSPLSHCKTFSPRITFASRSPSPDSHLHPLESWSRTCAFESMFGLFENKCNTNQLHCEQMSKENRKFMPKKSYKIKLIYLQATQSILFAETAVGVQCIVTTSYLSTKLAWWSASALIDSKLLHCDCSKWFCHTFLVDYAQCQRKTTVLLLNKHTQQII